MQRIDQYGKRGEQPPTPSLAEYRGGETDNKRHGPLTMSTLMIGVEMTRGPVPPTARLIGLAAEPDQFPSPNCPGSVTPHPPRKEGVSVLLPWGTNTFCGNFSAEKIA